MPGQNSKDRDASRAQLEKLRDQLRQAVAREAGPKAKTTVPTAAKPIRAKRRRP